MSINNIEQLSIVLLSKAVSSIAGLHKLMIYHLDYIVTSLLKYLFSSNENIHSIQKIIVQHVQYKKILFYSHNTSFTILYKSVFYLNNGHFSYANYLIIYIDI